MVRFLPYQSPFPQTPKLHFTLWDENHPEVDPCLCLASRGILKLQSLSRAPHGSVGTHYAVQGNNSGLLSCRFLLSLAVTSPAARGATEVPPDLCS